MIMKTGLLIFRSLAIIIVGITVARSTAISLLIQCYYTRKLKFARSPPKSSETRSITLEGCMVHLLAKNSFDFPDYHESLQTLC